MIKSVELKSHLCRFCKVYKTGDQRIPKELYEIRSEKPDLTGFPLPLPCEKSSYQCFTVTNDGAVWYGSSNGLTRYDKNAERDYDLIMYFAADRDLGDNNVKALLPDGNGVWALTDTGASHIEMKMIGPEEKAKILLEETLKYVDRRGMVSQKFLSVPRELESVVAYGHSDNDGSFTVGFSIGEIYRYAVYKREKGEDDPETISALRVATRACEACLLLMHIHGRGDGFVARSYLCPDEPVPDDGLFFRKEGRKAICLDTSYSR
ncbi:MAG: hypothetical protein K6F09_07520, partial [Clostridiales bacterium]|nr:hypothetical protein [Clostridiales bacterium]